MAQRYLTFESELILKEIINLIEKQKGIIPKKSTIIESALKDKLKTMRETKESSK